MYSRGKIIREWKKQDRKEEDAKQKCNFRQSREPSFRLTLQSNPGVYIMPQEVVPTLDREADLS